MASPKLTPVGVLLPTAARLQGTAVPFAPFAATAPDAHADQQAAASALAVLGAPPPRGAPV